MCGKKTITGPLQGLINPVEKPKQPFETLHMDCLGPLPISNDGFKHILVIVDAFTKYCILTPMKTVTTAETKDKIQHVLSLFGTPKKIIMDSSTSFKNTSFPKYLKEWQIEYHFTTPDIHRGNGQVERYMRTIRNLLRIETKIKSEWPSGLWKIQLVLNTTIQKSIGETPLQLLLGIRSATPLIQAILRKISPDLKPIRDRKLDRERVALKLFPEQSCMQEANRKRRNTMHVLMHRDSNMHDNKTDYEFLGPYEIVKCLVNGRYEIQKVGNKNHN